MAAYAGRTRVALVFGGRSTEHAISCMSAASVLQVLDRDRYEVIPLGIAPDGRWLVLPDDPAALVGRRRRDHDSSAAPPEADVPGAPSARDGAIPGVDMSMGGMRVALPADPTAPELIVLDPAAAVRSLGALDVVFPLLHGPFGEDGTIQGLLEMAGVPYVGSGVFASAASMDKQHMKTLIAAAGLPVGPYSVLRGKEALCAADRDRLGLPVFVKPARGGSSIGISRVQAWDELDTALETARAADPKVLVEAAVVGREIECGVLGGLDGAPPEASLPGEVTVDSAAGFYDFDAKYVSGATRFAVPARLPQKTVARVCEVAIAAFGALDCAGLARVDMFLTPAGEVVLNEVNTMPGFTPMSMFPRMWEATGLSYPALVDRLIQLALAGSS